MTPEPPGRIEPVNGLRIYFQFQGTGEPLLLLHGFWFEQRLEGIGRTVAGFPDGQRRQGHAPEVTGG